MAGEPTSQAKNMDLKLVVLLLLVGAAVGLSHIPSKKHRKIGK